MTRDLQFKNEIKREPSISSDTDLSSDTDDESESDVDVDGIDEDAANLAAALDSNVHSGEVSRSSAFEGKSESVIHISIPFLPLFLSCCKIGKREAGKFERARGFNALASVNLVSCQIQMKRNQLLT